jgi:hypothetical protein
VAIVTVGALTALGDDRALEFATGASNDAQPTAAPASFSATSTDGSIVVFETYASLVTKDTNGDVDVYEHTGSVTKLVSADNAGNAVGGGFSGMTPDASHIYFTTGASIDAADTDNGYSDLYDRSGSTTTFVSVPTGPGAAATETYVGFDGASSDGSVVVFNTYQRMTADDTDSLLDFYIRSSGTTTRISKPEAGQPDRSQSSYEFGSISTTGNHIFFSVADQLTSDDTDANLDIYDYTGGHVYLMSRTGAGAEATSSPAFWGGATPNGARVFFTTSQKLLSADTDSDTDVYRSASGSTADPDLMSVPGASPGASQNADYMGASSDGNTIWFGTYQSLIGATDTDSSYDIYQGTANTAATLVSKSTASTPDLDADAGFDGASTDGSLVFWETKQRMTDSDTDSDRDIYVTDSGTPHLASVATGGTSQPAEFGGISANGDQLAFVTAQQMTGDGDSDADVYVRGSLTGSPTTTLASAAGAGAGGASADAEFSGISSDGTDVFFSTRERLRDGDTNGVRDLYDRAANQTTLMSSAEPGAHGAQYDAYFVAISGDGAKTLVQTPQNLIADDTDSVDDLYVHTAGGNSLLLPTNSPLPSSIFPCGASTNLDKVIVYTNAPLTQTDTDNQTDLYSVSNGTPTLLTPGTTFGVDCAGVSSDGNTVVFDSDEQLAGADTDDTEDLYVRSSGQYVLLTPGTADSPSFDAISSDGSKVFFDTSEELTGSDSDSGANDVFMSVGGTVTWMSRATGVSEPSDGVYFDGISADGSRLVFDSTGSFTATDQDVDDSDVFVRDGGTTTLASQSAGDANLSSYYSRITKNGQHIFFYSWESISPDDQDGGQADVYDFTGGQTTLVSKPAPGQDDNVGVDFLGTTPDGSHVFLNTHESMTPDDTDGGVQDVYDRTGGQTVLVSKAGSGASGSDMDAYWAGSSTDGSRIFFTTTAALTSADTDDAQDVYERSGGVTTAVSPDFAAGETHNYVSFVGASDDGRVVAMETQGQLLAADTDTKNDVYVSRLPAPPPPPVQTVTETTPTPTQTTPVTATTPTSTTVTTTTTTTPSTAKPKPRCVVPRLRGLTLAKAKAKLRKANCRLGKVTKKKASTRSRGKVLDQKLKPKTRKPNGTKVAVTVGR